MTWTPPVPEVVMIAGGVGVTPFRSMLRDAKERKLSLTTTLLHVANNAFLYGDELQNLANEYLTTNRQLLNKTLGDIASRKPNAHYYIAGSPHFVATVANELTYKGITRMESDEFKGLPID
jgi:ferredoxin-NADP reductase